MWFGTNANDPERVPTTWISASLIPLLRVSPILGRSFTDDEDRARGPQAVVISELIWRLRFGGARDVIGKTLYVNAVPRVIVGVMPQSFHFPDAQTRLWLPAKLDRNGGTVGDFSYDGIARLKPAVSLADAQADLASALQRMPEVFPRLESGAPTAEWLNEVRPRPTVRSLRDEITNGIARTLWMLAAAAALVLLVACANVSNLMLIRADGRSLELSVREALGAGRLRIITHFASEALVLTWASGVAGLVLAWVALRALVALGPADVPRLTELHLNVKTVVFALVIALGSAAVCSIVPLIRLRRTRLAINLRDGGRNDTAGKARQRLRATIAAVQIGVALVLLAGSALLLRTFERLHNEQPGFSSTNVMTIWTQLPFARYGDSAAVAFYGRLAAQVDGLPGVRVAGLTNRLPLGDGELRQLSFRVADEGTELQLPVSVIDDAYFSAITIPLIAGHGFARMGVQRDGEVVVSRRAAGALWHDPTGRSAVGKRLTLMPSGPTYTVIGVVGDVRDQDLATAPSAMIYTPQAVPIQTITEPGARRTMALVVKTAGPPTTIVEEVRRVVRQLDPTIPIFNVETMTDIVRASTARLSFMLALMSFAAAITLILGAVGLYGVTAYMVTLRTREFGVRIALGVEPRVLARGVAARGMIMIAAGVGGGLVVFAAVGPLLRAFLYGVTPSDPITIGGATLALIVTGALANWLPARRAARVDPVEALRAQ
jgi:predicted permease